MAEDAPSPTGPRVSFMRRITGMAARPVAVHQPKSPPSGPRYDTATGRRLDKPPPKNPIRRRISTMLGLAPPVDPYAVGFESEGISAKQYMKEGDVGLYTVDRVHRCEAEGALDERARGAHTRYPARTGCSRMCPCVHFRGGGGA